MPAQEHKSMVESEGLNLWCAIYVCSENVVMRFWSLYVKKRNINKQIIIIIITVQQLLLLLLLLLLTEDNFYHSVRGLLNGKFWSIQAFM